MYGKIFVMGAALAWLAGCASSPEALRTGEAGHAFDHAGPVGDQAEAALACGDNIIYVGRIGELGYGGLPAEGKLRTVSGEMREYVKKSKREGIRLAIGYVCATSIVKLDAFDRNWTAAFRAQFHTPPADWRQQDKDGKPLPSWYGGDYQPACMNNPDWRAYEKDIVRIELESGCDGIFFDNPTVHPQGCYCPYCMEKFAKFLGKKPRKLKMAQIREEAEKHPREFWESGEDFVAEMRQEALKHPREFLEFRAITARDFVAEMRRFARSVKRGALVTCNNSLNTPDGLFAQIRADGYDINEMSRTEDYVLVEDMATQPRTQPGGRTYEYGPTYKLLHAINHGKPVVAVTVADADYTTAPDLMRLAMAEAAANDASYLAWPIWAENERQRMETTVRPEADFLRENEKLLNGTEPRCDVALFLCFRRWLDTDHCTVANMAAALNRENIQYGAWSEENFGELVKRRNGKLPVLLLESRSVLNAGERRQVEGFERAGGKVVAADEKDWLGTLKRAIGEPSVVVEGPGTVRVVVRDQGGRTIVHVYNLNVERVSSYQDRVHPAENVRVRVRTTGGRRSHSVAVLTADASGAGFSAQPEENGTVMDIRLAKVELSAMVVVE